MRRFSLALTVVACTAAAACGSHRNYPSRTFSWTDSVAAGSTVSIGNIDGSIAVIPSTTNKLLVDAVILNAAPNAVSVQESREGDVYSFCTHLGTTGSCGSGKDGDDSREHHATIINPMSFLNGHHSYTVRYTVHVPAGVKLKLETVSGRIAVQNATADVKAETVNGDVEIASTSGTVNAETVNGSIVASMAQLPDSEDVHLETVNGSITSLLPANLGGMLDLENTNGKITASYPHTSADSSDAHHLKMRLSDAPRTVHLETVNGSVNVAQYSKPAT